MGRFGRLFSVLAAMLVVFVWAAPARAQATRTWVSGVGDDANPCSRTAPCKTFAGAISKTATRGEINCTDPGGFGALTITKSITISCDFLEAGVLVSGTNGIVVNAPGGVVILKGLDIEGIGTGLVGVSVLAASAVHIHNCTIHDFASSWGIKVSPSSGTTQFNVTNSIISNNGSGGGILVQPTGTGAVMGALTQIKILDNTGVGLQVDGAQSTAAQVEIALTGSVVSGNTVTGVLATSAAAKALSRITIDRTAAVDSGTGIASSGSGADVTVAYSMIAGNSTGVSFTAPGTLRTYQTNQLKGNLITNGTFSSIIALE